MSRGSEGPLNLTAPDPVTNADFTEALGNVLSRPTLFSVPAFAARLAFGEMADELLLSSAKVEPRRLKENGYQFKHPELSSALKAILGD
jgi:NAD dependent epimerase/dehydratase family enzyme